MDKSLRVFSIFFFLLSLCLSSFAQQILPGVLNPTAGGTPQNTPTLVKNNTETNCSSSPCSITIQSTGTQHLLVLLSCITGTTSDSVSAVSETTSGTQDTWVQATGASSSDSTSGAVCNIWYVASTNGGATALSVTYTGSSIGNDAIEITATGAHVWGVDTSGATNTGSSCTTDCTGPSLNVNYAGDALLTCAHMAGSTSQSPNSPFTYGGRGASSTFGYDFPGGTGAVQATFTGTGTTTSYNVSSAYFYQIS